MFREFSLSSRSVLVRYFVYNACTSLTFFSAVLVPMFTDWAGLSEGSVNWIQGWFIAWTLVFNVPAGVLADRIGRKRVLVAGMIIDVVGFVVYASSPTLEVFLLGEWLLALGNQLMFGADQALLFANVPELDDPQLHARVNRWSLIVRRTSMIVGAIAGGYIVGVWGYAMPMRLTAVPMFVGALVVLTLKEGTTGGRPNMLEAVRQGWKVVQGNPCVRGLVFQMMISAAPAYFGLWLYQLLLRRADVASMYFGMVHAMMLVAQLVVLFLYDRFVRKFGTERQYFRIAAVVVAATYIVAAFGSGVAFALAFAVIAGGFGLTRNDLLQGYINPHVDKRYQATVLSYVGTMTSLCKALLNIVVGYLVPVSLSWTLLFIAVFAVLSLFVLPEARCFVRKEK